MVQGARPAPGRGFGLRESDRTLVCGDVSFNVNPLTLKRVLREPPRLLTQDPALNRESARRLGRLRPALVLFAHGPPHHEAESFARFAESLPG